MGQEERVSGEIAPKEESPKVPETEEANELTCVSFFRMECHIF